MRLFWFLIAIISVGMILLMVAGGSGKTLGIDNDNFADALWLVPLLLLFSAGFLQSRRNLGMVFQNLLIWAAIILVIATAYVFRDDFQSFGHRLLGGLVPGLAMTTTTENGRQQVILGKRRDGHFSADVNINGTMVTMLVDSGASRVTLSYEDAARIGIDIDALTFATVVQTANGTATAAPVMLDQVAIGPIIRRNVAGMVASEGRMSESLLGMSFLSTLASVDMRADELRLTD